MSTGLNCSFHEVGPGRWYYVLERGSAPKSAFDWREYADAYGPFSTEEAARDHLHRHHANPGGYWSQPYQEGRALDEVMTKLIAGARVRP